MAKKLLFLGIFLFYIAFINISDIDGMRLQQAGIAVLVEHKSWDLSLLTQPKFQDLGDVYHYQAKTYALKAPGLFIIGMPFYYVLDFFNINYDNHWETVALVMTIFLAIVPAVLILWLLYEILDLDRKEKYLYILLLATGSMLFSYSSVLSHDLLGLLCLVVAFYFYKKRLEDNFWQGFFAGLAVFFSYKFIIPAILFGLYFFIRKRLWTVLFALGLGFSFVLIWQKIMFGDFFLTPHYLASPGLDVFPKYLADNLLNKIVFYVLSPQTSLWANNLLLLPAILGLIINWRKKDNVFILLFSGIYLVYLLFLGTVGDCQYPPRYLMILIPFLFLGLPQLYDKISHTYTKIVFGIILLISVISNVLAATRPVINCQFENNVWQAILFNKTSFSAMEMPFWVLGFVSLIIFTGILFKKSKNKKV